MKKRFSSLIAAVAALLFSCAGTGGVVDQADRGAIEKNDVWFNIQNSYYQQYLIEEDGMVVYGNASRSDGKALWSITKGPKRKGMYDVYAIKNKASGRFIMPARNSDRLQCIETEDPFYWTWQEGKDGIIFGDSRANLTTDPQNDNIVCIHMERKKGYAENSVLNRTWGTPQWLLREYGEVKYQYIKSEDTGLYLYEDENDFLKIGELSAEDSRFHWLTENNNQSINIRNRKTGHNITIEHIYLGANDYSQPVKAMTGEAGWKSIRWILTRAGSREGVVAIDSGWNEYAGFRLYHRAAPDNGVYFGDTVMPFNGPAQWRLEAAQNAAGLVIPEGWIRLRNSGRGDFLYGIPESRRMVYGKTENSDGRSHWRLIKDAENTAYYRLRNRVSGYDAAIAPNASMIHVVEPAAAGERALWELSTAEGSENLLFHSKAVPGVFLNIDKNGEKGYAEGSSQSTDAGTAQWIIEQAAASIAAAPAGQALAESAGRAAFVNTLSPVPEETVFRATDAFKRKDEMIYTVYAPFGALYRAALAYQDGGTAAGEIALNGMQFGPLPVPEKGNTAALNLPLKAGINTLSLKGAGASRVVSLSLRGAGRALRGASVPWIQHEAESMKTNGTVLSGSRAYRQFTSEASGRGLVRLEKTGDYIEFTASAPFNALVLRYCIPDSPNGGGIEASLGLYVNGERVRDMELNSKYSWVYGSYPWSNVPDALPHRFFDDTRVLLDSNLNEGAVIRLQKDSRDAADYYLLDLVETELVPPPAEKPADALSILDYGAVANDGRDDTAAFMRCINAAARAKKEVWLPAGVFNFNSQRPIEIGKAGTVIRGAGMWHSVLAGTGAGFMVKKDNVSFYDFSLAGEETGRDDQYGRAGIETPNTSRSIKNLTVCNIWMEHLKVGVWTYRMDAMLLTGCRIRNTFADGINLCGGTSNSVVEQCAIRNTGDDAIALWSWTVFRKNDTSNKIRFNTAGLQWLANNIAIYGGQDNEITDNILHDTVSFGAGIAISANHDPLDFRGTVTVMRNTLMRCGGHEYNFDQDFGAIWLLPLKDMDVTVIVKENEIIDSSYQAFSVLGGHWVKEIIMENNYIDTCGTWGIDIGTGMSGRLLLKNNNISGGMIWPVRNASGGVFEIQENQ
jgi:hypothetical protein